ncbi:hypothetical protein, partial [Frankia sp. AgKG'84/4]|uniref:hypothetical protein n=1 Tax=Frankia sp. AgKG'84/4 TaxID=573490 RepID=UPI00202A4533
MPGPTAVPAVAGTVAPVSVRRLVHCGLVASVAFLLFFAALGAFGVLAFGALAALWSLGVAWIIIFGPPAVDGRMLREQYEDLRVSGARALRTHGGKVRSSLRGTASAACANLPRRGRGRGAGQL